jgi:hypothetical protein
MFAVCVLVGAAPRLQFDPKSQFPLPEAIQLSTVGEIRSSSYSNRNRFTRRRWGMLSSFRKNSRQHRLPNMSELVAGVLAWRSTVRLDHTLKLADGRASENDHERIDLTALRAVSTGERVVQHGPFQNGECYGISVRLCPQISFAGLVA